MSVEGLGESNVDSTLYLYWVETWNKAVAEAWRDKDFAAFLLKDPKRALQQRFGFVFQENIDLTVKTTPEVDGDGVATGWRTGADGPNGWNLPATEVTLYLPPAPEATEQAVAVMAYWETGYGLPFSTACC